MLYLVCFCMNLQILNFQVYQRVEKIFLLPISWICHGDKKVNDNLVKGGHGIDKRAGYVLRLNYSYDDKYLLEITSRIDASTALPKKYRWGVFPGVSVGWRVSQEDFFKEAVPFMENLKIRASAGRLGSDRAISNTMTYFFNR